MPVPTLDPQCRSVSVAPPEAYDPGERVWIHRAGSWRPGVVLQASRDAVTVRYRPAEGRGTGVDTVSGGDFLLARDDEDPYLDRGPLLGGSTGR